MTSVDVAVVGGGSGGFGAALAAARLGCSVLLVEKGDRLGGTSTRAEVSGWEPGCGGTGIPFDLYCRLKHMPEAVAIYRAERHIRWPEDGSFPGGEWLVAPSLRYLDTLVCYADGHLSYGRTEDKEIIRRKWCGVCFEPDAMATTMRAMLLETGRVELLLDTSLTGVNRSGGRVHTIALSNGRTIAARTFVDSTGDGLLCAAAGCTVLHGQDPRSRFHEPAAPEEPTGKVNGVSLLFRVTPTDSPQVEPLAADIPRECWWRSSYPSAHVVEYPNGDLNVNMLPTMEGAEFLRLGAVKAADECVRRIRAFWHHWQGMFPEWQRFRIARFASALGIRESGRVWCERMLTQQDVEAGLTSQKQGEIVAIADHGIDVHGSYAGRCEGVRAAYGVPYRCLVPRGMNNLLVACRAAGFSSIAASSCRLSRNMMQLGQAAGTAAALSQIHGCDARDVPPADLQTELRRQHVCLEYPPSDEILHHMVGREAQRIGALEASGIGTKPEEPST